ncbi:MAG: 7-cyano-7-deazaguanine synthase, partial [Planctomycetaceae bacterium]|nr:7-cyano-7-deazaguanine synthase [Planctomycetaceae bacterium]
MNKAARKGRAIVLLSGGLDSATAAAWAISEGYSVTAISFDYGQRHRIELCAAQDVAKSLKIRDHVTLKIDLASFGGSALVDNSIAVPKNRHQEIGSNGIPVTYVPAR